VSRAHDAVFVDTGAWIALAIVRDPLHARAWSAWDALAPRRTRLLTSVPVVLETFTYLDRRGSRELASAWRRALHSGPTVEVLSCTTADLDDAWAWLDRRDLHRLSVVDATSFVLMKRHRVRTAFSFDTHFAAAGFRLVG